MPAIKTVYDRPVQPYTPSLYMLSAPMLGRYRSYPHNVVTPIPGAGFTPATLVWGEQVLNLDGTAGMRRPYPYGQYGAGVPLRGLGQAASPAVPASAARAVLPSPLPSLDLPRRFMGIAEYLWKFPRPEVQYLPRVGSETGGTTSVTYTDRSPINWDALVEYAKITAVGTFVGIPVGLALGYLAGRGGRSKVAQNKRRRRRGVR
jgi:hypothetical protein